MKELKRMCENIREELEQLYNNDWTDEERDQRQEDGDPCDLWDYFSDCLDIEYTLKYQAK